MEEEQQVSKKTKQINIPNRGEFRCLKDCKTAIVKATTR